MSFAENAVSKPELSFSDMENAIDKLSKDLRIASRTINSGMARYLVDYYYQLQANRIRSAHRARHANLSHEPNEIMKWLSSQDIKLEKSVAVMLDQFSKNHLIGEWTRGQKGIGPIICAGIIANLDIAKAPTAGHFWSYAGIYGHQEDKWTKGTKRPWNAAVKRLCFLIGESFAKVSGDKEAYYGQVYLKRKEYEWKKNLAGEYAHRAQEALAKKKFGEETDAKKWYTGYFKSIKLEERVDEKTGKVTRVIKGVVAEEGEGIQMLPPAHIHARSKRYAAKLFLAHMWEVWYRLENKTEPPLPYAIAYLGHAHYLSPPEPVKIVN